MTYSLPFGLKQKPTNYYFEHGVIKFSCIEGKLFYTVKHITKLSNFPILKGEVRSKEHLDKLLNVKSHLEIPTIEVVQ